MKILTVIPELGVGGAEVVAASLAKAAAADGHQACVASRPGFRVDEIRAAGVQHLPLALVGRKPLGLAHSVASLRRTARPDLVHAHNPKAALVARLAFGPRTPIVATLHGVPDAEFARAARILRWAADRVVVVSPHLEAPLLDRGLRRAQVEVVVNSVAPLPQYPRERARAELGLHADDVVGVCPARLVDQKRHDLLVEAWACLREPATLLLAGDGPNRRRIEAAVAQHGLRERVRLLGERSDMARLLAAADFLVLATDWEGLPIAVLEAMGAGLPVVASDVPGVGDQFGAAVHRVAPGSVAALTTGLNDIITDPTMRAALGARGREFVGQRFGLTQMVSDYLAIYADLTPSPNRITKIPGAVS